MRNRSFHGLGALALALGGLLGLGCTGASVDGGDEPGDPSMPGDPKRPGSGNAGSAGTAGSTQPGMGGSAVTPGSGGAGPSVPIPPPKACDPKLDPGLSPLMRLSTVQYRNTVRDLLGQSGVAMVADELKDALGAIPSDVDTNFAALASNVTADHVSAYFKVASGAAEAISSKPDRLMAVAGACASAAMPTAKCVDDFLASFGRRAHRRPLDMEDLTVLRALNDGKTAGPELFRSLILVLLSSPRFLTHVEVDGMQVGTRADLLQLAPYEIASRLAYTFWQSMPDEMLFAAAADGSLATEPGFQKQLERVANDSRSREGLWQFWNQWLRLEGTFPGFDLSRAAFKALVMGERIGEGGRDHYRDMVQEIRELTEYVAFTKKGSLNDLLTTDVSVTKSADLARLYGVAPWDGKAEPPRVPVGSRAGIFTRSAMLVIGEEQTNPFHRGAIIRKRLLCDPLPSPDPTSLPPGSLDAPPQNPMMTTRQRYEKKMLPECMGCHQQFNDIGYVLENYDPLGRYRTMEKVFDKAGKLVAELAIDSTAAARVDLADTRPVKGPVELVSRVVESKKFSPCFAQSFFTYALRRPSAENSADQCTVDDLAAESAKPNVALGDVYKRVALQGSFRIRKVGAP
jgi:hypothetical protein